VGLAKSTYYYRIRTEEARKRKEQEDLNAKELIDGIHAEQPGYGHRKLVKALKRQGIHMNKKKVQRIQSKFGLFPIQIRRFVRTTDSSHSCKVYLNLLKDRPPPEKLNEVWVSDITYIRIRSAFVYLAVVLDLCSRKVIGWGISKRIDKELTLAALRMAVSNRKPGAGCIHHSDRGVQYAAKKYVDLLEDHKFQIRMSRKGNPYDNAVAESFMKILKYEEVYLGHYEDFDDVLENVPRFIEQTYNKKRIHSSIGYLTPEEFEWELEKGGYSLN